MNKVDMLWDIEQIKQLKARYARYADLNQWEDHVDVFTDDMQWKWLDHNGKLVKEVHGKAAMYDWIMSAGGDVLSVHHLHTPEIEIIDSHHATGIWPMMDVAYRENGDDVVDFTGYGHYHEKYVKQSDGQWKIKSTTVTRLRMDFGEKHTEYFSE